MIKVLAVLRRKPDMTREECHRYWLGTHADIAREMPGVRRYVVNLAVSGGAPGEEPPFDGVAELWFDDAAAYQAAFASEAGRRTMDDVPRFAAGVDVVLAEEHVMVEP